MPPAGVGTGRSTVPVTRSGALRVLATLAGIIVLIVPWVPRARAETGDVSVSTVCFEVHNGATVARVIGSRFSSGVSDPSRVVLLVHGHSGTRQAWDWQPNYSVARLLARSGYLVISYDRLTAGDSTYQPRFAGDTVTYDADREMIAEIVEQIRRSYPLPTAAPLGPCTQRGAGAGTHPRIVLIGHSLGAGLAGSYAGGYQSVAPVDAVVQADWSSVGSGDEASSLVTAKGTSAANVRSGYASLLLDDGSTPTAKSISPATCRENRRLLLPAGAPVSPDLSALVCQPSTFDPVPYGDYVSGVDTTQSNEALIARTPADLPVLLAFADRDCFFPAAPSTANPTPCPSHPGGGGCDKAGCQQDEVNLWRASCPCRANVAAWVQPDSGHSFMLAPTMPEFVATVVGWLHRHRL